MSKTQTNCKHGLDKRQELEARKIRKKLLGTNAEKEEVCNEIKAIFAEYRKLCFDDYFKVRNPALYSACKRLNLEIVAVKPEERLIIGPMYNIKG